MINVYPAPVHYEKTVNGKKSTIRFALQHLADSQSMKIQQSMAGKLPDKLNGKCMVEVKRDGCTLQLDLWGN